MLKNFRKKDCRRIGERKTKWYSFHLFAIVREKKNVLFHAETKFILDMLWNGKWASNEFLISHSMHAGTFSLWMKWKVREQLCYRLLQLSNLMDPALVRAARCNERWTTNEHTHTPASQPSCIHWKHEFEWSRPFNSYSIYHFRERAHRVARIPFRLECELQHGTLACTLHTHSRTQSYKFVA